MDIWPKAYRHTGIQAYRHTGIQAYRHNSHMTLIPYHPTFCLRDLAFYNIIPHLGPSSLANNENLPLQEPLRTTQNRNTEYLIRITVIADL
jgi:hypothetical protein